MGNSFFSHRVPGRTGDGGDEADTAATPIEGRDRQQAAVLDVLRRAAGAPVSFAELREAGVELPASVVSELELAGVAIERCSVAGRGAGVRLDPANEPAPQPAPDVAAPPLPIDPEPEPRTRRKGNRRAAALAALVAGIAFVSVTAAILAAGGHHRSPPPIAKQPPARITVATATTTGRSAHTSTRPPAPVPVSPALAADLEAQGHSLLDAGEYGNAVPVLKRAVLATGETLQACLVPANTTCLTYAYALYDLGRAERLSGEPQAAVPILERRLQIDNQRSTVGEELQLARQGIS